MLVGRDRECLNVGIVVVCSMFVLKCPNIKERKDIGTSFQWV